AKNIQLRSEPPIEPLSVLADADELRTILDNLVDNAIKYTESTGHVTVRWQQAEDMGIISVEDDGAGIPLDRQARIFERFYRVDKARDRQRGGTGLGLSIVKHLCQLFGGSVEVESQMGKGSTFRVRLPLVGSQDHVPAPGTQSALADVPAVLQ
ncbi:MAG: GHKL domain-containing protein, partial [Planctomycetaceae bacterium]|nr:GHKL domain-containing protein [Planctomycetaceae bacterium]